MAELLAPATAGLPRFRATLGGAFECGGVGLHTGKTASVRVSPVTPGHGIVFRRRVAGGHADVAALWPNRRSRPLCTALQVGDGPLVRTVEHLLASFSALAIDDALVEIDGEELPIFDGSARPWCERILAAGRVESDRLRRYLRVLKRKSYLADGGHKQRIEPSDAFLISCAITLTHFGQLRWIGPVDGETFVRELAPSRSFGRLKWALLAKLRGLFPFGEPVLRGASAQNTLGLVGASAVGGLRMADEPVRHRALDMVGDFALAGYPILGRITASRPGHEHNYAMLETLMQDRSAWEIIEIDGSGRLRAVDG